MSMRRRTDEATLRNPSTSTSFHREDHMKQLFLLGVSLLAISACAPQPPPPPAVAAPAAQPVGYRAGPPANMTFYDGTYNGSFAQNMSAGGTAAQCPNYRVA